MAKEEILDIDTIGKYNDLFGFNTQHPGVAVVNFDEHTQRIACKITLGFYCLFLKQTKGCTINYGKTTYDFDDQTVVSFGPGQTVVIAPVEGIAPRSVGILFHPDFIRGTSLGQKIRQYTFFSYASNEALHLSAEERGVLTNCFSIIKQELAHAIDRHTRTIICANIELILDYCLRFYERQFVTRQDMNFDVLHKFETLLDGYLSSGMAKRQGLPTVSYFADKVCLSANYFGDLIKKETGKTAKEYIDLKLMETAKQALTRPDANVTSVAALLGFGYPQHFVRFFKRYEGVTPRQYRENIPA